MENIMDMMQGAMPQGMEAEQPGETLTCPQCSYAAPEAEFFAAGMQTAQPEVVNMAQFTEQQQPQMSPEEMTAQGYNDRLEPMRRGNVSRQAELLKAW